MTGLRKLQLLEVNLLQQFQKICKENNLTYYFTGGGLIGVLRHGGFIPWDDDMDIVMPREDYDKFVEICKSIPKESGYSLVHHSTDIDENWHTVYSKFVDLESVIERPLAFETFHEYVWADILPVDGMPDSKLRRWLHMQHVLILRYILVLTDIEHRAALKKRPFYETLILWVFKIFPIFKLIGRERATRWLEDCMRKYKFGETSYGCNLIGKYRSREIQPIERWGKPTKLLFEGIEVDVPELYHDFQTHMYGDYMKLPPKEMQIAHEVKLLKHRAIDFEAFEKLSLKSRKER